MTNKELIDKIQEEILHLKMKELQRTNGINTGADVYLSSCAVLSILSNVLTEESEDERIRKKLYHTVMGTPNDSTWFDGTSKEAMLAWLEEQKDKNCLACDQHLKGYIAGRKVTEEEKQKEQKEELVYRLNGLMQDYIKEGKDDEEKEHRLKCYQLFWDALEDTNFFEQKEQMMGEWLKDRDGCFWDGVEEGKKAMNEQMLKEAVECDVIVPIYEGNDVWSAEIKIPGRYEPGDRVRIIIVKED